MSSVFSTVVLIGDTRVTYFYLLVSNGNLTLVFHAQVLVVAIKTATLVHTVRINKREDNLAARPEKFLDLSFLNVFRGIFELFF